MSSPPSAPARDVRPLLLPAFALVAAIALAIAAFTGGEPSDTTSRADGNDSAVSADGNDTSLGTDEARTGPDTEQQEALAALERREAGDPLALGDVDAPVVMIEWADFQCRYCAVFARDTKPALMERYVDAGLLRFEWRDLPVLGEESQTAALVARAAAEQDGFWDLHDEIYAQDRPTNAGHLDESGLFAMAEAVGLDTERLRADLDDPSHLAAVQIDREIGQQLGITGTPAFLVNGRPILGGQPTEVFFQVVDLALAEAGVDVPAP